MAAVADAMPSGGETQESGGGTRPRQPPSSAYSTGLVATHPERGPVLPKSVTQIDPSRGKRSARSSHQVQMVAAWPGVPLFTTMSAPPSDLPSTARSPAGWDGSSTVLRLFALCSAKRTPVPPSVGRRVRDGLPSGLQPLPGRSGAEVGQHPGHRVAVVVGQIEYPQRCEQVVNRGGHPGQRSVGLPLL